MPRKKLTPMGSLTAPLNEITRRAKALTSREISYISIGGTLLLAFVIAVVVPSPAAITINGQKISKRRFQALLQDQIGLTQQELGRQGVDFDPNSTDGAHILTEIRNTLVQQQVNNILLYQEALSKGVIVPENKVDAQVNLLRAQAGEKNLAAALKQKGIREKDLREDVMIQLVVETFLGDLIQDVVVKGRDAREYYEKNRGKFERKDMVKVRHILTKTKAGAEECLKEIRGGVDFAEVARKKSIETIYAPKGGDWGYLVRGQMRQKMEVEAFSLTPGEVSGIVGDTEGFHIIKVEDVRPAGPAPFSEARENVVDELLRVRHQAVVEGLLDDLRRKAIIEINL